MTSEREHQTSEISIYRRLGRPLICEIMCAIKLSVTEPLLPLCVPIIKHGVMQEGHWVIWRTADV